MGIKLVELEAEAFQRGNILRVRGKYPYEKYVDFMLFETLVKDRPYGLIVTSGYKAGSILIHLPKESTCLSGGVNKEWMLSNWDNWIYPDCDVSDVYVIDGYEAVPVST